MRYIEISNQDASFRNLKLKDILFEIAQYSQKYIWSLQFIEAVGHIDDIIGMNMLELEKYCDLSDKGLLISFETLCELSMKFDDVLEVCIVGCKDSETIPKAFKTSGWEDQCAVIIIREDSSWWNLYATDHQIMDIFRAYKFA